LGNYEEWDVTIPSLPPRSRLYRLEPIGIGTPSVESLTSYIARLADAHCVSPAILARQEILPLQCQLYTNPKYATTSRLHSSVSYTLNGASTTAKQWVEVLQMLTLRHDLRFLTMLTWDKVLALGRMLCKSKAWCSACYREWRQKGQIIYEPLLWSIAKVEICSQHQRPLTLRCPYCQSLQPLLSLTETRFALPGYCCSCQVWLGCESPPEIAASRSISASHPDRPHWISESIGELLAAAPTLQREPQQEHMASLLNACVEKYTRGNMTALARLFKVPLVTLRGYILYGHVPHLDDFLRFCQTLSISPLELLTMNSFSPQRTSPFALDQIVPLPRSERQLLTQDEIQLLQCTLRGLLQEDAGPFPSLQEVARRLGCPIKILHTYAPDLCQAIMSRHQTRWSDEVSLQVKQALENALTDEHPQSLSGIAWQLKCAVSALRKQFPDLCLAISTRYTERFDSERIKEHLQEMLAGRSQLLSVTEFARQEGCTPSTLSRHFPDECKQMVEQRRLERRKQRERRVEQACVEVRQVVLMLHQQGIHPGSKNLLRRLSNPHVIRKSEVYETWRALLVQLGYQIDG
jgi:AraC-like DNA-binding protein